MKHFWNNSIRNKLLFSYVSVLIISMILFGIQAFNNSGGSVKEQNKNFTEQILTLALERLDSQMMDIENTLDSVQANRYILNALSEPIEENFWNMLPRIEDELSDIDLFHKRISVVQLYTLNQPVVPGLYASDMVLHHTVSQQEPWFSQTMQSGGKTVWNVFYNSFGEGKITASRVLYEMRELSRPIGVIRVDVDLLPFLEVIDHIKLGQTGKIFLVWENSIITIDKTSFLKDMINNPDFFRTIRSGEKRVEYVMVDNTRYLLGFERITDTNLIIAAMVPAIELDGTITAIGKTLVEAGALSMLLGILIALLIASAIAMPITKLSGVMQNFEDDVNVRVSTKRHDELGQLYGAFNKMMDKIQNLIREVNLLSHKQKDAELKALQAQINPHFLYNTLESINWMAVRSGETEISDMVSLLGSFFRYSLNNGREFLAVENELQQVKSFVAIEQIRFKDKFDIVWNIDPKILGYTMLKLTIQPIVENCIVHGFDEIDYKGEIIIEGEERGDELFFRISDNGVGTDAEYLNSYINAKQVEPVKKGKYGIRNVQQRLKLYFGEQCGITFSTNESGGLTTEIRLGKKQTNQEGDREW